MKRDDDGRWKPATSRSALVHGRNPDDGDFGPIFECATQYGFLVASALANLLCGHGAKLGGKRDLSRRLGASKTIPR